MVPTRWLLIGVLLLSGRWCEAIEPPGDAPVLVTIKPRSLAQLQAGLRAIADQERKLTSTGEERERQEALLRLRTYRFLCQLPERDLTLETALNDDAVAVADICKRLGKLSHAPENPDLPEEEYQRARAAAGKCNLSFGTNTLTKAIDMWMDDSDANNLGRLGHRRWCLNPSMQKLGLGRSGDYCAMWAFDSSRKPAPDYDVISFPPAGYVPIDFFAADYAWSITVNPAKYRTPDLKTIAVELFPIEQHKADREHPLELEDLAVETQGFGVSNCIIFRPKAIEVRSDKGYLLEVRGLQTGDGTPVTVSFVVVFAPATAALADE